MPYDCVVTDRFRSSVGKHRSGLFTEKVPRPSVRSFVETESVEALECRTNIIIKIINYLEFCTIAPPYLWLKKKTHQLIRMARDVIFNAHRQTNIQTGRQAGRRTDRQTHRPES